MSARYPTDEQTGCCLFTAPDVEVRVLELCNISQTGIGLVLDTPLEMGALACVELTNRESLLRCTRLMKLRHVQQLPSGGVATGWEFSAPLTYDQLQALLWQVCRRNLFSRPARHLSPRKRSNA
jgi:hypothetical protein